MDSNNTPSTTLARPPPLPPSRRPTAIPSGNCTAPPHTSAAKPFAPSPPPKPTSLSSPAPPRKPIAAPRPNVSTSSTSTSPSAVATAVAAHAASYNHLQNNGFSSAPTSPTASHVVSFNFPSVGSGTTSPAPSHLQAPLRSQPGPSSPSYLRPSASATFELSGASPSIAAKQQLLMQQQQQQDHRAYQHDIDDEDATQDPFSDSNNITASIPTPISTPTPLAPASASPPSFPPRLQNQPSLLTARLQSPSLHAPVPQHGSHPTSPRNVSSPPPLPNPALPPRTRSPLSGQASSAQLAPSTGTPVPGRQNTFSQRLSGGVPAPPSYPGQATVAPSPPVPPPPRRSSVQFPPSTAQQQPRGTSPNFSAPGESGMVANAARYRNLTAPQPSSDHLSPQPKRVFSSTTSANLVPGFNNMDLSDSQSDTDGTSDDSDKDYDDADEDQPTLASNPFSQSTDTSPYPTRARTFAESPAPPSTRARPLSKAPPPRQPGSAQDNAAPALPPKPAARRRVQPQYDTAHADMDPGTAASHGHLGAGFSTTDGEFPDYSRSNRRLPLFSDVIGIHDIQQKSHGVRTFTISNEQVATATSNIRIYSVFTGENISSYGHEKDTKPTALMFTQSRRPTSLGQYLWAGWSEGSLQVIDTRTKEVVEKKRAAHKGGCIIQIIRCNTQVWTVDDTGSVFVWPEDPVLRRPTLQAPQQCLTIPQKQICAIAVKDMLWSSDGSKIHVTRVGSDGGPKFLPYHLDVPFGIGPLTCMATIAGSGQVFSGHEDGKVVVWSIDSREKTPRIINVHAYRIMSLLGVGSYLWAGFATGKIYVLDLRPEVPVVMKDWQAHKDSGVAMLQLDEEGLLLGGRHQVGSCAENGEIKIWDGLMAKDRLTKGMVDRSKEYCRWRELKVLICSWNIDASKPAAQEANGGADRKLFESWLTGMDQDGPPDIISVGFQEIVDLESKKMTAKTLLKGSKRAETETISKQYKRWQTFLTNMIRDLYSPMGVTFKLLKCSNLVGLFSCVFVRDQEWGNVKSEWTHVDMVKTGLKGYHGNKGGIATRLIVDDTSISFVNCHLAAGQSHTRQRNTDAANVLKKLCHPNPAISSEVVHPEVFWFGDGTMAMDHEVCFLSGDLNYRIDVKFSEAVSRVQAQDWAYLHQYDQLLGQKQKNPQFVLRAFNESELRFAPTYKYDPGTDTYDTSSKHRTPAWCDRILWRGRHIRQLFYKRNECRVSDHRPISGGFIIKVKRIDEAQRRVVEQQVKEGWLKVQEKEIRIKKMAWLRSWGWTDPRVESILDREGGDLAQVVRILGDS